MLQNGQGDTKELTAVRSQVQEVQTLVRDGKFKEAEEASDRVLKTLKESEKK